MKMNKISIVLILLMSINTFVFGQQVSKNDAIVLAKEIYAELHPQRAAIDCRVHEFKRDGHTLMYEVLMDNDVVLLSGNYKCKPFLAISQSSGSSFLNSEDSLPCGLTFMLDWYKEQISHAFSDSANNHTFQEWRSRLVQSTRVSGVGPLTTSKWEQGFPYNAHIPSPLFGDCEHALVGCVAVAIGQLMYYYNHPVIRENQVGQFDWCNMKDYISASSSTAQIDAVSMLLAECADEVHSIYGCDGTTSLLNLGKDALVNSFKYNTNASLEFQENHSDQWWKDEIIGQLNRNHPVPYAGATSLFGENGHAFICDGYNELGLFHFNWGWGGQQQNTYCEITHIYSGSDVYDRWLCAIFYAYPENRLDLCDGTLSLEDYYDVFYETHHLADNPPYTIVPKSMAFLKSASINSIYAYRTIPANVTAFYRAHEEVELRDGFTVEEGADFTAEIVPCPNCDSRGAGDTGINVVPTGVDTASDSATPPATDYMAPRHPALPAVDLHPNPTSGELTMAFDGEVQAVVILNALGQPVGGWSLLDKSGGSITLDVSPLATGAYILSVTTTDGNTHVGRFIRR